MIQTHLLTCKDWATLKDTVKSLEHIIMKCNPPTLAMPMRATGATVPGLYSHIAHSVDKEEGEIPQPFKGAKPKQTRGRGKPKRKPQEQRQNPPKAQEVDETYTYKNPNNYYHNAPSQSQDHRTYNGQGGNNFEGSHNEIEAKDLSIVNVSFKIIAIREAHHNKIVRNMATVVNPIFRGIMVICIEAEAMAVDLNNSEDAVMVGPIIRITMECISISITHTTHNQNNMVLPAVYVADLTIPPNTATRVNMT